MTYRSINKLSFTNGDVTFGLLTFSVLAIARPPTGLFYIERDPHSRAEIGERDIVLSAQE